MITRMRAVPVFIPRQGFLPRVPSRGRVRGLTSPAIRFLELPSDVSPE